MPKKKMFRVVVEERTDVVYHLEAQSREDAIDIVKQGIVEPDEREYTGDNPEDDWEVEEMEDE